YNGPGYARRSYHTRMAQAYARHSKSPANSQ
ncbi:N-acetylmuramidase domain-containing protein, partial [uncultured Duncaniella sp.]